MIRQRLIGLAAPDAGQPRDEQAEFGLDMALRGGHAN